MYFTLPNLSHQLPSTAHQSPLSPPNPIPSFPDKEDFRKWCVDSKTTHLFYSLVEGLVPGQRCGSSNPPHRMWGFAADYDGNVDTSDMVKLAQHMKDTAPGGWAPTWVNKTYSGKARAVWEFQESVLVDDPTLSEKFIDLLFGAAQAAKLARGMDPASKSLTMFWEAGTDWTPVSGTSLDRARIESLLFEAAKKTAGPKGEVDIPMDVVADRVEELFPGRWIGPFEAGRRGPLFWVPDGIDRVGCVVQEHGMWAFSSRATQSFTPWSAILGSDFVSKYREAKLADAVEDVWYDGKRYWMRGSNGDWVDCVKDDYAQDLRLAGFGHKPRKKGDPASEIDEVMGYVRRHRRIQGVAPFPFNFKEVVRTSEKNLLNESYQLRVMPPAEGPDAGNEDKWPTIFEWWNNWMEQPTAAHFFLAWLQRFYQSSYRGEISPGHTLILAGGADLGKSLFATHILGRIFKRAEDAGDYLAGNEAFNINLCRSAVWYVDDNESASDSNGHRKFTERIKKVTATSKVTVRDMYRAPVTMERRGRVVMTTNTDADSLSVLPYLDGTIRDKLIILKLSDETAYVPWFRDKSYSEIDRVLDAELPHLLAWLLHQYVPPKDVVGGASSRMGINAYIDPTILWMARDLSPDTRWAELIQAWWNVRGLKEEWEGNATELISEIHRYEELRPVARELNCRSLGRLLSRLVSKEEGIEKSIGSAKRVTYTIKLT